MKRRQFLKGLAGIVASTATGEILSDKALAQELIPTKKDILAEQSRIEAECREIAMPWIPPYACRAGKEYTEKTEGVAEYIDVWQIKQDGVYVQRWLEDKEKNFCNPYKKYKAFHNNRSRELLKQGITQGNDKYADSWKLIGEGENKHVQIERIAIREDLGVWVPLEKWTFGSFKGISKLEESNLNKLKQPVQLGPKERIEYFPRGSQKYYEGNEERFYQLPPRTVIRRLK